MKTNIFLALLLVGNVVLGFRVIQLQKELNAARASDPSANAVADGARDSSRSDAVPAEPAAVQSVTNTVVKTFNWEAVESADYREYIDNLRSVGCPEETIRDIIIADVNKLYEQKQKAVRGKPKPYEYWKGGNPMLSLMGGGEKADELRALEQEKLEVLRALGIEPDFRTQISGMVNPVANLFSFLPEQKQASVLKLMTDMQHDMANAFEDGGRPDMETLANAQRAMEEKIKAILTPEEFLDYQLRMSSTAQIMRTQLAGFEPSQEEFLAVFKLRQEFDQNHSPLLQGTETDEERQEREAAQSQLDEKIKAALGEDRYADYQRGKDYEYQQIHQAVKRADLEPASADRIYEMKSTASDEANRLRSDASLTREQRTAALHAIRAETESSVREILGDDAWERYKNQAFWLNSIAPPPAGATEAIIESEPSR